MALSYSQLAFQSTDEQFIRRVQFAILQDANANRIEAVPPALTSVLIADQRDRLGRSILADPQSWAVRFARVAAAQLIGKTTLLDEAVTTDGDIFSACSAVYDHFLPIDGSVIGNVGTVPTLTKGTQSASGYSVQELKDAGRASIALTAEAVAGSAAETLVTLTQSLAGAVTSTGTSYNVTAGKTFRLQAIVASWIATTTTANTSRVRVRVNASGAALITSPLQASFRLAWPSATFIANEGTTITLPVADGFELPGGAGLAVTHLEAAANGTLDLTLFGYEY